MDDPWQQHALWYGNCKYLQLLKGQEFVMKTMGKFPTLRKVKSANQPTITGENSHKTTQIISLFKPLNTDTTEDTDHTNTLKLPGDELYNKFVGKICFLSLVDSAFLPTYIGSRMYDTNLLSRE